LHIGRVCYTFNWTRLSFVRLRLGVLLLVLGALPASAAKGIEPLEFKQRYQAVLEILAAGDLDRALSDLTEIERQTVGEEQTWRHLDRLWRLKLQVIRDLLVDHSPDLLRPIIVLHHDAYFRYSEAERPYLAQHSRTMSGELAEVYAERAGTASAGAFAGWLLSSLAATLWSPSNVGGSADLFYRTYMVDPGNPTALRGLAVAYERAGDYDKAIEYLMLALRQEPRDPELLLRLSLCQLRRDETMAETVGPVLATLSREGKPDWIRSVAYQELGRLHVTAGEVEAAARLLREGLEALPGDQQLSLQLAAILDRQRRRSESLATLDAIRIDGWERDSSRLIYDFWSPPDLAGVREELRQEMQKGLAPLATALNASGGAAPVGGEGS
jgi:tetratricopeptide (TPR) repeat protein